MYTDNGTICLFTQGAMKHTKINNLGPDEVEKVGNNILLK